MLNKLIDIPVKHLQVEILWQNQLTVFSCPLDCLSACKSSWIWLDVLDLEIICELLWNLCQDLGHHVACRVRDLMVLVESNHVSYLVITTVGHQRCNKWVQTTEHLHGLILAYLNEHDGKWQLRGLN